MISRWWFSSIWNFQSLKFFIFNCYYSILELCIFMYCSLDSGCMLAYKDHMNKAAPSENWTICPVPQKPAFPVWHPSAILNLHTCLLSSLSVCRLSPHHLSLFVHRHRPLCRSISVVLWCPAAFSIFQQISDFPAILNET